MDEMSKDWIIKVAEIITDLHRDAQLTQMLLVQEREKRKAAEGRVKELEQSINNSSEIRIKAVDGSGGIAGHHDIPAKEASV